MAVQSNTSGSHISEITSTKQGWQSCSVCKMPLVCYNPGFQVVTRDWILVAYSCNPRYSGGTDQKDHSWKIVCETLTGKTSQKGFRSDFR
jgi:hypothetical protein